MEITNEQRAQRALLAVAQYPDNDPDDLSSSITDLVADLLHLAYQYGIEPDYVTHTAQMHYQAEAEEEAGL